MPYAACMLCGNKLMNESPWRCWLLIGCRIANRSLLTFSNPHKLAYGVKSRYSLHLHSLIHKFSFASIAPPSVEFTSDRVFTLTLHVIHIGAADWFHLVGSVLLLWFLACLGPLTLFPVQCQSCYERWNWLIPWESNRNPTRIPKNGQPLVIIIIQKLIVEHWTPWMVTILAT